VAVHAAPADENVRSPTSKSVTARFASHIGA
jgi:hypothetical protein